MYIFSLYLLVVYLDGLSTVQFTLLVVVVDGHFL